MELSAPLEHTKENNNIDKANDDIKERNTKNMNEIEIVITCDHDATNE